MVYVIEAKIPIQFSGICWVIKSMAISSGADMERGFISPGMNLNSYGIKRCGLKSATINLKSM